MKPSTPKGTRDFSPAEMARRNYIFDTVKSVFRTHGFAQIETPAMENSETLMGKYGEEGDRLIFKVLDSGNFGGGITLEAKREAIAVHETKDLTDLVVFLNEELPKFVRNFPETADTEPANVNIPWKESEDDSLNKVLSRFKVYFTKFLCDRDIRITSYGEDEAHSVAVSRFRKYLFDRDNGENVDEKVRSDIKFFFENDPTILKALVAFQLLEISPWSSRLISEKALRYDLTVPFARYVVQHRNDLTFPFKRFQIQPVWRADRPQKGRYREFYQCDVDVIGSDSLLNEVELVQIIDSVFAKLNVPVTLKLNNRKLLAAIAQVVGAPDAFVDITVALDKLDKIGEEKVVEELKQRGISDASIEKLLPLIRFQGNTPQKLNFLTTFLGQNELGQKGIVEVQTVIGTAQPLISPNTIIELDLTLARGLNYYTGAIFEVRSNLEGTLSSSISGGGRYDDLTGIFGLPNVSGVGISFGADRIYDVLLEAGLFPSSAQEGTKVLFVNFGEKEALHCLPLVKELRGAGIATELYPDAAKLKKQFGHADSLGIPFVAMVGDSEMAENVIALKDMRTGEQERVTLEGLVNRLSSRNP